MIFVKIIIIISPFTYASFILSFSFFFYFLPCSHSSLIVDIILEKKFSKENTWSWSLLPSAATLPVCCSLLSTLPHHIWVLTDRFLLDLHYSDLSWSMHHMCCTLRKQAIFSHCLPQNIFASLLFPWHFARCLVRTNNLQSVNGKYYLIMKNNLLGHNTLKDSTKMFAAVR